MFTCALIRVKTCRPSPVYREVRSWNTIDFDSFSTDLANAQWSSVFETDNVETQNDCMIRNFTDVLDVHAPVRRVRVRSQRPLPLSENTRRLVAARRAALRGPDRAACSELNRQVKSAVQRDMRDSLERRTDEAGPNNLYVPMHPPGDTEQIGWIRSAAARRRL